MKIRGRLISFILTLTLVFCFLVSCGTDPKEFTHCELTLVLDESFKEEKSESFDLFLSNGDVAISLLRISFQAGFEQGIIDTYTAKGFAAFFMHKSEKSEELLMYGDVPYYTYTETSSGSDIFYTVTFYRSFNAYFVVAYAANEENKEEYRDKFLEYADKAYFNDAPQIENE